jgi:hypothetical protein
LYTINVDVLDHIVAAGGEYANGMPKQIVECYRGDVVDLSDVPADRIEELVASGAISEAPAETEDAPAASKSTKS